MIGLDSNVLLAWLLDDASSTARPVLDRIGAQDEPVYLNHIVLSEVFWVLRAKFSNRRVALGDILQNLLDDPGVVIDSPGRVAEALAGFRQGGPGFTDHLIGVVNRDHGCRTTLTLDRTAARHPLFTPLPEV